MTSGKPQNDLVEEKEDTLFLADDSSTSTSSSSSSEDTIDGVKLTGYTITIIVIFCVQIFICFAICVYSQNQIAAAKRETVT